MNAQRSSIENETEPEPLEKWRKVGKYIAGFLIVVLVVSVKIFDVFHPVAEQPWIHRIAEIEPTVLAALLLTYVFFERLKLLGPTKKKVDSIADACVTLSSVPRRSELSSLLDAATANVVEQLSSPVSVRMNESAEATYTHILRVLESVEKAKSHTVKTLRHGIFHAEGARNTTSEDDQSYFAAFREKMKQVSASDGANRWNVNVLYNVTHADRLSVILDERLNLGTAGYKVRAMCLPDFSPVFSPMIVDDQHVFLAVFEEGKNRVSKSVYMHGQKAAKFFADYFDTLWADQRVKILRKEGINNQQGIKELKASIRDIPAAHQA